MAIKWIRESNLIEGVDDPHEDSRCARAYAWFLDGELNQDRIKELHDLVMAKQLEASERGKWRKCRVIVGGRLCPPPYAVASLMDAWMTMYSKSELENTIRQAHIEFEKIHPFVDGNGRTGRMIMQFQRAKVGLKPLLINSSERGEYYSWFKDLNR